MVIKPIVQLTTVHRRSDTRIKVKECSVLKARFGSEIILVVADGKGNEEIEGLKIIDIGKPIWGRIGRFLFGGHGVFIFLMKIKPKVIHFHDPELIPIAFLCKIIIGCRVVYDVHESVPDTILRREWLPHWIRKPISSIVKIIEKTTGLVFDRVVVATPTIGKRFLEKKTVLIQNFPIKSELSAIVGESYENRSNDFVYVGGISQDRAVFEMIEALNKIDSERKVRLHMAGNFQPQELKNEVENIAGWPSVVFHGWADRLKISKILGKTRCGLVLCHPVPNYVDSQPTKLYEYMSAGLPVIASDFPAWRQIVNDTGSGLLVDPEDSNAIVKAMEWMLDYPREAKQMGVNGKRAIENLYNWETESKKLIKMYEQLLSVENAPIGTYRHQICK